MVRMIRILAPVRATPLRILAPVVMAVVIAACLPAQSDDANGGLGGTSWTVVSIAGTATIKDARPTMTFVVDGQVSGSDGCNNYGGPFKTEGGQISVGLLTATLIGCPVVLGAQGQAFMQALGGATAWRRTEAGSLELRGHGDILAEPTSGGPGSTAVVADLAGTAWVLEEFAGGQLMDTVPTILFGGDGMVSGSAGCNTFSGTYVTDGATIGFGPLATTKMACGDSTMFVESAFLAALAGVTGWSVDADGRLDLAGPRPLTLGPG